MKVGKTTYIQLEIPQEALEDTAENTQLIIQGVENALKGIADRLKGLSQQAELKPLVTQTVDLTRHLQRCDGQLAYLRINLGRLRNAIAEAAAPLGAVLLPVVSRTVYRLSQLAQQVGLVLAAVTDTVFGTSAAAKSTDKAAAAQKRYSAAVASSQRSLADFDQIQRLNAPGGTGSAVETLTDQAQTLTPRLQQLADKLLQLLEPLRSIDLAPVKAALSQLGESWSLVWSQIGSALQWLWNELLAPFLVWVLEELAPVLIRTLAAALETLAAALGPLVEGLAVLWEALKPVVGFIGQQVVQTLEQWQLRFERLSGLLQENAPAVTGVFQNIAQAVSALWTLVAPVLELLGSGVRNTFGGICTVVTEAAAQLTRGLQTVTAFLAGIFTGNWQQSWQGIVEFLRWAVNGMIGLLNSLLSGVAAGINGIVRLANSLQFTVPAWIPELGGKSLKLNLKTVSAPKIPYLAQGAVLPANRPFLAVVGDQRHGTNVEAPLATIQQAVLEATAAQNSAAMAALQASVEVQQQILEAVLGIRIGDDVLAHAVDRYNRKMAVVYGTGRL